MRSFRTLSRRQTRGDLESDTPHRDKTASQVSSMKSILYVIASICISMHAEN